MNRYVLYYDPDQTAVEQAEEYLTEQGIATLESAWNPEDQVYELSTLEEEFEQAKSLLLRFLNRQLAESSDDAESTEESGPFSDSETKQERLKELKELLEIQSGQHAYVNKHTQFEDNFSSALILLTFGVLGVIFIVFEMCGITHILTLSSIMRWVFYISMGILFCFFIFWGIRSLSHSRKLRDQADTEDQTIQEILDWGKAHLTAEAIDSTLEPDLSESDLYFNRAAVIQQNLDAAYPDLEVSLRDELCERIYEMLFE